MKDLEKENKDLKTINNELDEDLRIAKDLIYRTSNCLTGYQEQKWYPWKLMGDIINYLDR